jgi:hypothetical protein
MKKLLLLAPLALVLVAVFLSSRHPVSAAVAPQAEPVGVVASATPSLSVVDVALASSATETELLELSGLDSEWRKVETNLAPVVSNAQQRVAVIRYLTERATTLGKSQDAMLAQVARRIGQAPAGHVIRFDPATSAWITTLSR